MARLAAVLLLFLHACSCFPLLPWGEIIGSNAIFSFQKCLLLTLLQGCLLRKLGWHRNFYHTTTTEPPHPNPKKHIRKKPPTQQPPARASMSNKLIPASSVHSSNLVHDKDFSAWEDSTEKDIFPPPARRPTHNGAPPKSSSTRT
jgi:hypothetical protein